MNVKRTRSKCVLGMLAAVLLIVSGFLFTESASACTLPPNTYAYPGECVLYNLDGTKYEEPKQPSKPHEEPQAENQDQPPRYSNSYWAPFSYGYGYSPFGHHYYPRHGLALHLGFGHHFGHFGHHRSHH